MITERPDSMDLHTATLVVLAIVIAALWATRPPGEPALSRSSTSSAELVSTQAGNLPPSTMIDGS